MQGRAGSYIKQSEDYVAFIPMPLPPNPEISYDAELIKLLSQANRELGRLDGTAETLPNPDLFVSMYVKKEAVLSSQIEGTQASLTDVLVFESDEDIKNLPKDVGEVVNYVKAMNYGLNRLDSLSLSLRLIKEIHGILLENTRGGNKNLGEFRRSQNWIGPGGCSLREAVFVPPPVPEMNRAMGELELYMHKDDLVPTLIKVGLIHSQFETIHPFLDGNGRVGRLLITFLLCQQNILNRPLLYLSYYFKKNRNEYYNWLMKVRNDGDWEGWLKFFLTGIIEVSIQAISTAKKIINIQNTHNSLVINKVNTPNSFKLLSAIFIKPILSINDAQSQLDITYPTASNLFSKFEEIGILQEITGQQRNRLYAYTEYLNILNDTV